MTAPTRLPDFAARAFSRRITGRERVEDIVGRDDAGELRVYEGWPSEVLEAPEEAAFPRWAYSVLDAPVEHGPREGRVRVQVELFTWTVSDLRDSDAVLMDLLEHGARWHVDGTPVAAGAFELVADEKKRRPYRRGRRGTLAIG